MLRFFKYFGLGLCLLLLVGSGVGAYLLSRSEACPESPAMVSSNDTMQGVRQLCYGPPETLYVGELDRPAPGPGEVRVKVHAAGVNPLDWHTVRGSPYFMRLTSGLNVPSDQRFGADFAGVVDAVGEGVSRFKAGDRVFGGYTAAFSEYLVMPADKGIAQLPDSLEFDQGASVAIAGLTALQALRDHGDLQPGQRVLINGASGGVGTFAVQMAKAMGAEVHGVCSTRNVERVLALGADHVYDYKQENYTEDDIQFDLILDLVGNHSPFANASVLKPSGKVVMIGGPKGDWLGPIIPPVKAFLASPFLDPEFSLMLARFKAGDLETIAGMMSRGEVLPVIDRYYPLAQVAEALAYSETGRAQGKIILQLVDP